MTILHVACFFAGAWAGAALNKWLESKRTITLKIERVKAVGPGFMISSETPMRSELN